MDDPVGDWIAVLAEDARAAGRDPTTYHRPRRVSARARWRIYVEQEVRRAKARAALFRRPSRRAVAWVEAVLERSVTPWQRSA